jgi:hypothetical protein
VAIIFYFFYHIRVINYINEIYGLDSYLNYINEIYGLDSYLFLKKKVNLCFCKVTVYDSMHIKGFFIY